MDADEREVFHYLKTWGSTFVSAAEVAKRATNKKRFFEDPNWAKPVLMRMVERGILESNVMGRYRIKPVSRKNKNKRWVAPDIAKILQENGLDTGESLEEGSGEGAKSGEDTQLASDEHYDNL